MKPIIRAGSARILAAAVLATTSLAVGDSLGGLGRHDHLRWFVVGAAVGFVLFGGFAVNRAARQVARFSEPRVGVAAASAVHLLCSIFGYVVILLGLLQLLNVNPGALLFGGAVTGVILGIAAQQILGSFFAGLVLLFARPYVPGQQLTVHSGALGGPLAGTITEAGLLYTTLATADGPILLPNSGLLAAAIGPPTATSVGTAHLCVRCSQGIDAQR